MASPIIVRIQVDDKGNIAIAKLGNSAKQASKKVNDLGKTLKNAMVAIGVYRAIGLLKNELQETVRTAMEFELAIKKISYVTGTFGSDLDLVTQKAKEMALSTEHGVISITDSMLDLVKMGREVNEVAEGMPHFLDLATASMSDLKYATESTASLMMAFKLPVDQTKDTVDKLAKVLNATKLDFTSLMEAVKYVSPVAHSLNMELDQTLAVLGMLSQVGIEGSMGGTVFRGMLLEMLKTTPDVAEAIGKLSFEGDNLVEILGKLDAAGAPVDIVFKQFNRRALVGALAIGEQADAVENLRKQLNDTGVTAASIADGIRDANLNLISVMRNFIDVMAIELYSVIEYDVREAVKDLNDDLSDLREHILDNREEISNLAGNLFELASMLSDVLVAAIKTVGSDLDIFIDNLNLLLDNPVVDFLNDIAGGFGFLAEEVDKAAKQISIVSTLLGLPQFGMMAKFGANLLKGGSKDIARLYPEGDMSNEALSAEMSGLGKLESALKDVLTVDGSRSKHERELLEKSFAGMLEEYKGKFGGDEVALRDKDNYDNIFKFIERRQGELSSKLDIHRELEDFFDFEDRKPRRKVTGPPKKDPETFKIAKELKNIEANTKDLKLALEGASVQSAFRSETYFGPRLFNDNLGAQSAEEMSISQGNYSPLQFAPMDADVDQFLTANEELKESEIERLDEIRDLKAEIDLEDRLRKEEEKQWLIDSSFDTASTILDIWSDANERIASGKIEELEKEKVALNDMYMMDLAKSQGNEFKKKMASEKRVAKEIELEKKIAAEKEKASKREKMLSLLQATGNVALAVTDVIARQPAEIFGKIAAGLAIGSFGAGYVAQIASLSARQGAIVPDIGNGTSDSVPYMLSAKERIVSNDEIDSVGGHHRLQAMLDRGATYNNNKEISLYVHGNILGESEYIRDRLIPQIEQEMSRW